MPRVLLLALVVLVGAAGLEAAPAPQVDHPYGVAYARGVVYVADFGAGLVRRVSRTGKVTTIARLRQVAAVAVPGTTVYAVSFDGTLARVSGGRLERVRVLAGLARPHGVTAERTRARS